MVFNRTYRLFNLFVLAAVLAGSNPAWAESQWGSGQYAPVPQYNENGGNPWNNKNLPQGQTTPWNDPTGKKLEDSYKYTTEDPCDWPPTVRPEWCDRLFKKAPKVW